MSKLSREDIKYLDIDIVKAFQERLDDLIVESGKDIRTLGKETGISTGSLSAYRNGTASAGIDKVEILARYFNTSCAYLLGEAECKKASNEEIMKATGLSEESIEVLSGVSYNPGHSSDTMDIINHIIPLAEFWELITTISHYGLAELTSVFSQDALNKKDILDKLDDATRFKIKNALAFTVHPENIKYSYLQKMTELIRDISEQWEAAYTLSDKQNMVPGKRKKRNKAKSDK